MLPTFLLLALLPFAAAYTPANLVVHKRASPDIPETPSTTTDTDTCNPAHNGLATGTLQYVSDCNATTYCRSDGSCQPKGCRRDDFPLGYPPGGVKANGWPLPTPDKCPEGQYCPDEGTSCQPLLAVGSPCQLDRDDECLPPPDFKDLRDESGYGLNVNGSICLNFICQYANVTAGQQCDVENVGYITYGSNLTEYVDIVSRDNCKIGLYCDVTASPHVCTARKTLAATCTADKECASFNCSNGSCGVPVNTPRHYALWVYIVIGVCIFGGMIATLIALFFLHRRDRDLEREKRLQYWREQNALRQNILQMQESARASVFTSTNSRRSTMYGLQTEDSAAPMLRGEGHKGSGLRYYVSEDGYAGSEHDLAEMEGLVMQAPYGRDDKTRQF